jgi:phosphoribosylformylglycinamidine cyclo-ligase
MVLEPVHQGEPVLSLNYKNSGVDIDAGDKLVDWLSEQDQTQKHPFSQNLISGIGGFASVFRAKFPGMQSPCLVTSTDGVGTKVKLSSQFKRYETIGQDLVGMCVNDILCVGAQPLFFLDYFATGKLELTVAQTILKGIKAACNEAECMLVGGETAEMPGVYAEGDYDLAGFVVGVVDENKMLGAHKVKNGDVLLGVKSSGFHSNGYSLLRKLYKDNLEQKIDSLLTPTKLYTKLVHGLLAKCQISAVSHITGGGLDNILRVVPENLGVSLKRWNLPDAFKEVQKLSAMEDSQLYRTLNCGLGLALIVPPNEVDKVIAEAKRLGEDVFVLGEVVSGSHEWVFTGGKA